MYSAAAEEAINWLVQSGIQDSEGAFASGLNREYGYRYPEVTGYGITLLCKQWRLTGDERLGFSARKAVKWLLGHARRGFGFACRQERDGQWLEELWSFDIGMIINALVAYYEVTGERMPLDVAIHAARWLTTEARRPSGELVPRFSISYGPIPDGDRWSTRAGPHQAKVVLGLLRLARVTGDEYLIETARQLCHRVLRYQDLDGRFITDLATGETYIHAHCYAVEGLAGYAFISGDEKILRAATKAVDWLRSIVRPDGGVPCSYDGRNANQEERSDSTAQTLRLLILLKNMDEIAHLVAKRLLTFQCRESSKARRGGFRYSSLRSGPEADLTTHGTMFAAQALYLFGRNLSDFEWLDLV